MNKNIKKDKNTLSAPFPTVAQSDYIQNGLVLPRDIKNLELLLKDVQQKGYLDIEFCYLLRQRESTANIERKIENGINNNRGFKELVKKCLEE
jgi:hypothetical protein